MKRISLLGATGSIGTQTLNVVEHHPDRFSIVALAGGRNIERIIEQARKFKPRLISVQRKEDVEKVRTSLSNPPRILFGQEGLIEVATHPDADFVMNAVVGSMGLEPTLSAIEAGKDIGIANKETLVTAGHLVMEKARKHKINLMPVDSEHSAIFQSLEGNTMDEVNRLIVTASGGSFRDKQREELNHVTVKEALNHPNWSMGAKITIDSATMINKGFEVIEAHWLFNMPYDQIDVLLHRESIIHSLVEYMDGSVIAQLGTPDMRGPIQYAMSYPKRLELNDSKRLNLWEAGTLHFNKPDFERYRCLQFAYESGRAGGTLPAVLNAANEVAVDAFLSGKISFLGIEDVIERALTQHHLVERPSLNDILEADKETRAKLRSQLR